ncbi:MAG: PorV/PorQ family protein [bacterium]
MKHLNRSQLQKTFLFFAILSIAGFNSFQAFADPGTTGAVELKIPVGPRPIAMGGAFVAVADDANAIYWNPAGLRQLGGVALTAQYTSFIDTVNYNYFAGALPLGNDAAVGVAAKLLTTGNEQVVDAGGNLTGSSFNETYADFDLAGALKINYYLDIGIVVKYITKSLASNTASTFAFDLGALYRTPIAHLTAGMDLQNIGPGLKFVDVSDPLPFNVKVGMAYKMFDDNFTMAMDFNFPTDNDPSVSVGGEYWYMNTLVGRFGYELQGSFNQNELGNGAKAGLYLGAGVKVEAFKTNIGLDYAWSTEGFLGTSNRFALNVYL